MDEYERPQGDDAPTPEQAQGEATPPPPEPLGEPPTGAVPLPDEETEERQESAGTGSTLYTVLGVAPGADRKTVSAAYDRLAAELQPDENTPPTDPERMRLIEEAFDVLDNPESRAEYDRTHGILGSTMGGGEPAPEATPEEWLGRPDYYTVLGVVPGADRKTVAIAYERLARELQPDEGAPPSDPEKMRRIDEAFDVLDDPKRRAAYDTARGIQKARRRSADRGLILAIALLLGGIAAIVAAAVVLLVDFSGDDGVPSGPIITTDSGLQYIETKVGSGNQPKAGDQVSVEYVGMLQDGTVFDTSEKRGFPFTFLIGQAAVIPGWDEGISTMHVGGKRRLIIPPELGYGDQGFGDIIPPGATIIFDVELVDIKEGQGEVAPSSPPDVTGEEITTASGLKYIDIKEGTGVTPLNGQTVSVHYTGWLQSDGTKFDSSLDRGQPIEFPLGKGNVIAGWDEGLSTMKVGGKRRLIIPPDLGYGASGSGPIPANATLIFDVELLDVR